METLYIVLAVLALFFIVNKLMTRGIKSISTTELKSMLAGKDASKVYIDVRTVGEFKTRKIKGFKNIPLDQLEGKLNQVPEDKTIVLICQSGSRSTSAARKLLKAGYKDILNVRGGMTMWK